ncbi:MAG: hypothetical protein JWL90_3032 [Chthoniobacteraceae bacterium]|nr:hypothetical protein [Chthoniobacteraceae bacterium]
MNLPETSSPDPSPVLLKDSPRQLSSCCCGSSLKTKLFAISLVLLGFAVGALFLQPPGFGDDLTYWNFAFNLHRIGLDAWHLHSFHDLRWPVWGVCWLLQKLFHFGFASYFGEPLLYLAAGALLSFLFGKKITGSPWAGWSCGVAFLFHPLLDTVAYRPMPDLSEGVWGACVILGWWAMMNAPSRSRSLLFAVLTGISVYIAESNRITGVFIIPVLIICTLMEFRARFHWLLIAGGVAALFYGAEALFYHGLFGDWLHNIHANLGNKGAKGTGSIALWRLPLRFMPSLWKGSLLAPAYCLLALLGSWLVLRHRFPWSAARLGDGVSPVAPNTGARTLGRVTFVWFVTLYLEYSCAPQGFKGGWNPMIRDADRFLCGLVVPMSILAVLGLVALFHFARQWRPAASLSRSPVILAVAGIAILIACTARETFDSGFIPKMRRYMAALPPGTKIFTHDSMRGIAYLVDPVAADKLVWNAENSILNREPQLETLAAQSDEFWYVRKLVWLNTRKKLQKSGIAEQEQLGSYFEEPDRNWITTNLLAKGDTPDLIFLRRRTPADPLPKVLPSTAPEFNGLIPVLPAIWTKTGNQPQHAETIHWPVPQSLRGQFVRIELEAAAKHVEALVIRAQFFNGKKLRAEYLLKPYLHPQPGKEFFAFEIPSDADTCEIQPRFSKEAATISVTSFRAVITAPPTAAR